jgi:hypothetical protein
MLATNAEMQKEFETFIENVDPEKLSRSLRNLLCEYLAQNAQAGLSIWLDDKFFLDLQELFILLDALEKEDK